MRTITPRAKFTIESDLNVDQQGCATLCTPKMFMNMDFPVSDLDIAIMFLNMAKHHMIQSGSREELATRFIAFMDYHADTVTPGNSVHISKLKLSDKTEEILLKEGITTITKLKRQLKYLLALPGIGEKRLEEITQALTNSL